MQEDFENSLTSEPSNKGTRPPGVRQILSRAPTRIDLAGGTVDIWPLYLFLKNPVTVNLAISLYAEAEVRSSPDDNDGGGAIVLQSEDQKTKHRFTWQDMEALNQEPVSTNLPKGLELHAKLLAYFSARKKKAGRFQNGDGITLKTRAQSPAGAGLGGSSALSIAIIGALAAWETQAAEGAEFDCQRDGENFIQIVRDIETTVIQVPAGLQDYYSAMYGGLQSLRWKPGTHEHHWLPQELITELQDRLLLFYSGQSRNSGINNWALFKGFIDQPLGGPQDSSEDIRAKFGKISEATAKLETALRARRWTEVGAAIQEEWSIRQTLASGISTPEIDRALSEASRLTPMSGKVCGAGGGGCFFVYLSENQAGRRAELKARIQEIFLNQGMRPLPFHGVPRGLEVRVGRY